MLSLIEEELNRFLLEDDGQPVVMLNLLRFQPVGGRERYSEYLTVAGPLIGRYGAEIVFVGDGLPALSAEVGQSWDAVALVRYPSRHAFVQMVGDAEYREKTGPMRKAALIEAVLQPIKTANP